MGRANQFAPEGRERAVRRILPQALAPVSEPECAMQLRALYILSAEDWARWCRAHGPARRRLHLPVHPERAYRNPSFWKEYRGHDPTFWPEFHRGRGTVDAASLALWARYAARYKVASSYRGVRFSGVGEATARGYSTAFGVFLSYSALEACWRAMGAKAPKSPKIDDVGLAARLRAALGSSFALGDALNKRLEARVVRFMAGDDSDVLVVATAIRHLVAHGIFTPWGSRVVSAKGARTFQDLADAVLRESARQFRDHIWPERSSWPTALPPPSVDL